MLLSQSLRWAMPIALTILPSMATTAALFPGEIVDTIAGNPTLYRYSPPSGTPPSNTTKPLVVFIPGGVHTARIAYGGHNGSRPSDFLAHHANAQGFPFLAISYPVETSPDPILPPSSPFFRVGDWGEQAAQVAAKVIAAQNLSNDIILASWSMGGRVVVPFTASATKLGLKVQMYAALAATPGLRGLASGSPGRENIVPSANGYATGPNLYPLFIQELADQSKDKGRTIIPREVFDSQYWGNTPVGLLGWEVIPVPPAEKGGNWTFVDDGGQHFNDTRAFEFAGYPWVATLYPSDQLDFRHALGDRLTWGFIFETKLAGLVGDIRAGKGFNGTVPEETWNKVLPMVRDIPGRLASEIDGNHFFFVGERGARRTAAHIARHWEVCQEVRRDLAEVLGVEEGEVM